jgi:hypothetical protein
MTVCGTIACAAAVGCGDDKTDTAGTTTTGGSGGTGAGGTGGTGTGGAAGSTGETCTTPLQIIFDHAYSAYDGQNTYKVPAIALGVTGTVKWTASDESMVYLDPDAVQFGDAGTPPGRGVMITTRKAGTVTITASAGSACGSSQLTIAQATPEERQIGSDRYNNGVPITFDGGRTPACSNCHGATSNTMFLDVQHTPQQTGGYSDEDLVNIFTKGQKPPGGGCRVISCGVWASFHQWQATEQEMKGIVYYLRSLEPAPQGAIDFGGTRPPRDGGVPRN